MMAGAMVVLSLLLFFGTLDPQSALTVPAGTHLEAKLQSSVKTARSEVGDDVEAVVTRPLGVGGTLVVPRGSRLSGRVETIQAATRAREGRVRLVFREIELPDGRHVSTWITNAFGAPAPKRALRYIGWMGGAGAAGGLAAGKTARAAGILGGMLAGFVIAGNKDDSVLPDLTLRSGKTIRLELGEDLTIPRQ
jgi:Bacterial conjugation TrbI-like protein